MNDERIVMQKSFSLHGATFVVNPLQDFLIKRQIATNEVFARAYHTDMTKVFYDTLDYKVKNKENIATGLKGATRSGKSLAAASINWHTATLYEKYQGGSQRDYFGIDKICANESEYAYKVKEAKFGWTYQVDEQREAKFQMGCLSAGTLINVITGGRLIREKLGSMMKTDTFDVPSYNFNKKQVETSHARIFDSGMKRTFRITTETGKTIDATGDHKFFVRKDEKITETRLGDIRVGDEMVVIKND